MLPRSNPNFSPNWRHIKSILGAYPAFDRNPEVLSFADHLHAKALSVFLTNATLATPCLDRATVAEVLEGHRIWPREAGTGSFEGVSVPLSFLEENGFITFYAGWATIHCILPKAPANVHQSLVPLIAALEHLQDICFGRNGCIQPHYVCSAHDFEESMRRQLGNVCVQEILPELRLENGNYRLPPSNGNFSPLVSKYLWVALQEQEQEPAHAFRRWIKYLRVNCDWAMPVLFEQGENKEREAFEELLLDWIARDRALEQPAVTLQKQFQNEHIFSSIVSPVLIKSFVDVNLDGNPNSRREETIELEKPTLDTLSSGYHVRDVDNLTDLQNVIESNRSHMCGHGLFYSRLIASTVEASIRIDGQMLVSSGVTETLLELAKSRPILRHIMFNELPRYESSNYQVFLLSKPATCDIALFYLTQKWLFRSNRDESPALQLLEQGFQQLACHEYLRAISAESEVGDRLIHIVEFLSDSINLKAPLFSASPEYRLLLEMLNCLDNNHVIQLGHSFVRRSPEVVKGLHHQLPDHYMYLLGFWLIDRLDAVGINPAGTLSQTLKASLVNRYEVELKENLAGNLQTLEPTTFFSNLPWHKLFADDNVGCLLGLSSKRHLWDKKLVASEQSAYPVGSAIRHYLQVLMCVGKPQRVGKGWDKVATRVADIVRTLGIGDQENIAYLFQMPIVGEDYDLWKQFCSYTNLLAENVYEDFMECCADFIPLNQLFVLLERTTIVARSRVLEGQIALRQSAETERMGLGGLEQAFISACDSGHAALSEKLLRAAKELLERRFRESKHREVVRKRKLWMTYEYKWMLIDQASKLDHDPDAFAKFANGLEIPHNRTNNQYAGDDQRYWQECEYFRRYITAATYLKTRPEKCVAIMEALYKQSEDKNHSFMLFRGRAALYERSNNASDLRLALSRFLSTVEGIEPDQMPNQWAAAVLEAYMYLQDTTSIDVFWEKLSIDQKNRVEIIYPYSKSLIARGKPLVAKQVVMQYRDHNQSSIEDLNLDTLIDELARALPEELSMSNLVQVLNEQSQRTKVQLRKHYRQIVNSDFSDYADIVEETSPEEFLRDIILEIAQELILRKKNLQLHEDCEPAPNSFRITHEDLINDWFTSLFDKRMAEAHVGFRDQKRAGESESGSSPGEVDGYITDAKNNRIAIFEAFRLFSKDATVISEHLDKIASYDNESLSPVFIAAYCDVRDFGALVRGYIQFISDKEYAGFTMVEDATHVVHNLHDTDHLWMGMERRRRGARDIVFYHLLLRMGNGEGGKSSRTNCSLTSQSDAGKSLSKRASRRKG